MFDPPNKQLVRAREKAGYKTASAAHERYKSVWGFAYSTYISYENGQRPIPAKVAAILATTLKSTGLKFTDLYPLNEDIETAPSGVPVVGEIRMGRYQDLALDERPQSHKRLRGLPSVKAPDKRRALHVLDESVNRYIGPGEYAVYTPVEEEHAGLEQLDGELLYVECMLGKLAERSIRLATLQKDGRLKLVGYSSLPKYAASPAYYPCKEGNVSILGVIVGHYAERTGKLSTRK